MSQPAASQHLKVLRDAGLVRRRVDGRRRLYRIDPQGLPRLCRTIDAPAEVVWAHLTTAGGLVRWVRPQATADPVPGRVLRWTHHNGARVVGRFVELVPYLISRG